MCTTQSGDRLGHCRSMNRYFDCLSSGRVRPLPKTRASAFPEDDAAAPGGDEVIVFDTPLLTSAADALPGTEARLAEFINPDGQEFEAVDTECVGLRSMQMRAMQPCQASTHRMRSIVRFRRGHYSYFEEF